MQRDLREERQQRRDLVGDDLRRMIVAVVHQRDAPVHVHRGVGQRELAGTDGVRLHANAEDLALDAGLDLCKVKRLGEDLVDALTIAPARAQTVRRDILEAVSRPDVHHARLTQLLGQIGADADARLAVLDPEAAGLLIGRGQRQRVALGMGEERGIEVRADAARFAVIHPRLEVLGLQPVAVHPAAVLLIEDGVACVEADLLPARTEGEHLVKIGHQLLRRAGAARIIARRLDAAGQGLAGIGVKAAHIVSLPAVDGHRYGRKARDGLLRIHAQCSIPFSCFHVAHIT